MIALSFLYPLNLTVCRDLATQACHVRVHTMAVPELLASLRLWRSDAAAEKRLMRKQLGFASLCYGNCWQMVRNLPKDMLMRLFSLHLAESRIHVYNPEALYIDGSIGKRDSVAYILRFELV